MFIVSCALALCLLGTQTNYLKWACVCTGNRGKTGTRDSKNQQQQQVENFYDNTLPAEGDKLTKWYLYRSSSTRNLHTSAVVLLPDAIDTKRRGHDTMHAHVTHNANATNRVERHLLAGSDPGKGGKGASKNQSTCFNVSHVAMQVNYRDSFTGFLSLTPEQR